jgi:hypothetical protein
MRLEWCECCLSVSSSGGSSPLGTLSCLLSGCWGSEVAHHPVPAAPNSNLITGQECHLPSHLFRMNNASLMNSTTIWSPSYDR